jgi:hypothetical protein
LLPTTAFALWLMRPWRAWKGLAAALLALLLTFVLAMLAS